MDGSKAMGASRGGGPWIHHLAIQWPWMHPNDGCEFARCPNASWNGGLHALGV